MKICYGIRDDRSEKEREVYTEYVIGYDTAMSGRLAPKSYAAWACKPEHVEQCFGWVNNRSDMADVEIVDDIPVHLEIDPDVDVHIYKYDIPENEE